MTTPKLTATQQAAIRNPIQAQLQKVTTQEEFDLLVKQAADAGAPINQGFIDRFQLMLDQRLEKIQSQQSSQLAQKFLNQLGQAATQQEFDAVLSQAKAANVTLNQGYVDAYQSALTGQLQRAETQRIQTLTQQYTNQLAQASTQQEIDSIVDQAQQAGAPVSAATIDKYTKAVATRQKTFDEIATTVKNSGIPTDKSRSVFTKSGAELVALPSDPTTGREGGWYMYTGQGLQSIDEQGRPTGPVIATNEFNQLRSTIESNVSNFQRDQQRAQEIAQMQDRVQRFEAELPQPGSEQFKYLVANRFPVVGPDGRQYEPVAQDLKSGAQAQWIVSTLPSPNTFDPQTTYTPLGQPDQVITKQSVNELFDSNAQIMDARAKAERAALIAQQKADREIDFGKTMRFALGVVGLTYGAMLLAQYGSSIASSIMDTAGSLAGTGSTAGEIGTTLETLYGVSPEVAAGIGSEAASAVAITEAQFLAADAAQLAAQGLGQSQIASTLVAGGAQSSMASAAANLAASGLAESAIAQALSGVPESTWATLSPQSPAASVTPVTPAAPGAAPISPIEYPGSFAGGMEPIQLAQAPGATVTDVVAGTTGQLGSSFPVGITEAEFLAADAAQLSAQGIGQSQIASTLVAGGADAGLAASAAQLAASGLSPVAIAESLAQVTGETLTGALATTPTAPITTTPAAPTTPAPAAPPPAATTVPPSLTEAQFIAADSAQLAGQGLSQAAIEQNLIYSGAAPAVAAAAAAAAVGGASEAAIAAAATSASGGAPIYGAVAETVPAAGSVSSGISTVTEAEFVAADAAQLAGQGLSQAQIESTLLFSGVDPLVAADAAALAAAGLNEAAIAQNITQSGMTASGTPTIFNPPGTPPIQEPLPGYMGPEGSAPIYGTNVPAPIEDISRPFDPNAGSEISTAESLGNLGEAVAETLPDLGTIGSIAAGAALIPQIPQIPERPDMGTFTPASPDPSWNQPLQYPGVNPGLVGAAVRPAYETTSPVQSRYYWGRQPYFAQVEDLANYNQVPMPAQPFGIQQGYFEQPLALPSIPVYGENMFIQPQQAAPQSAQVMYAPNMQPLPQTQPMMMMTAPVAPSMLPAQPQYVYNVAPTAAQYSVPGAAPV